MLFETFGVFVIPGGIFLVGVVFYGFVLLVRWLRGEENVDTDADATGEESTGSDAAGFDSRE